MAQLLKPRIITTRISESYQGDETATETSHTETQYRLAQDDRLTVGRCGIVLERGGYGEDRETVRIDFYDQPKRVPLEIASMIRSLRGCMESTDSDSYRQEVREALDTIREALS